jgi:hypothetical protein
VDTNIDSVRTALPAIYNRTTPALVLTLAAVVGVILSCRSDEYPTSTVRIDFRDGVTGYPAAFVSLERSEVVPVPDTFEGVTIDADIWVEPGDPEVLGLSSHFEEATHPGSDTRVALAGELSFEEIKSVPEEIDWTESLEESEILTGTVFFVRSSNNHIYKVLIDEWNTGPEAFRDAGIGGFVQLSFARIK